MSIKKILVIRFSSLGDIILATGLFRELKKVFPDAEIDFFSSTTFGSICANNPHISNLILLDRSAGKTELNRLVKICQSNKYDLILDAHRSLRSRLFIWKYFNGFPFFQSTKILKIDKRSWQRNLLLKFKINVLKNFIPQRKAFLNMLSGFTNPDTLDNSTELFPGAKEKEHIAKILTGKNLTEKSLIAIGPSASFTGKCWPKESFKKLIEAFQNQGHTPVILGGKSDEEPKWLMNQLKIKPVNLAGDLSFLESAELLRHCRLAVSNDSAIVHLAEAVETPAISIFGPTVKEFGFGPYRRNSRLIELDLPCRPCSRNGKGKCKNKIDRQCMKEITVETVFNASEEILE